ncbi:LTA synthase family protein [Paenibacillus gorillae]|uniref:LTA synthase family protein n=1 Tax=Paenibacillus gorillae TaxID=1243662 RepID=UPI0004B1B75B|nr:LTA synthase family protein [Paenibacillus gorillae]
MRLQFFDDGYRRSPFAALLVLLIAKFVLFRVFLFKGVTFTGMLSDLAAILAVLLVCELAIPGRWKGLGYWLVNFIISLLLFASTVYFAYYGSIPTFTALKSLNQVGQIGDSINALIKGVYFVYFIDLAIIFVIYLVNRFRGIRVKGRRRIGRTAILLGSAVFCLALSVRSVYVAKAISNELEQAQSVGFINYQAAAAWQAGSESLAAKNGSLEEVTAQIKELQSSYPYQSGSQSQSQSEHAGQSPVAFGQSKGKNVIVIQLEAFQNFPIHLSVGGEELTPVLNKLVSGSYYFPHVFQQIGQGNTSDAEFMSNTSIYPVGNMAMSTGYGDRQLPSMPRMLQTEGYEAYTFHVNDVTFWNRDKLYPALHFNGYYDKPYYENDNFNEFGPSDEELYKTGIAKLSELHAKGQPFYAQFVSVSSHFPFKVPEDRGPQLNLPEEIDGTHLGDYLRAVHYTDYALGTFIDQLKAKGMWDDTVLLVYGDHFGLQPDKADAATISSQLGIHYDSRLSRFNIPFIVHDPSQREGHVIEQPGGQLDMMPTLANLLGLKPAEKGVVAFGRDLLNTDHNVFGMRYYLPTGSFFNNEVLFVPGKGFEDGTAVSLKTMEPVADIEQYRSDYDYIMQLMNLSDQYVRLLPKRGPSQ